MTRASEHSTALVTCETTKGQIVMEFFRDWSPLGFERAVELFDRGFYDHSHFFRVVHGFLVQFGISYTTDKELQEFAGSTIPDDPVNEDLAASFEEGIISFAGSGKNSRTSHLFIAYGAIPSLGKMPWETPVGKILMGTDVIRNLNGEYGDGAPNGNGPPQYMIKNGGIEYMNKKFPNLDSFITCSVDSDSDDGNGAEEKADDDDATNPDKAKDEEGEVDEVAKNAEDTAVVARATAVDAKERLGLGNGDGNGNGDGGVTSNVHVPIMAAVLVFLAIVVTMRRRQKKVQTKMG